MTLVDLIAKSMMAFEEDMVLHNQDVSEATRCRYRAGFHLGLSTAVACANVALRSGQTVEGFVADLAALDMTCEEEVWKEVDDVGSRRNATAKRN